MKDETFTGKGILINKKTGEVIKLGDVTIKEICNGELEPGDEHIELNRPSFIGGDKITFSVKVRSKRKWRKMIYSLLIPNSMNRKYISKREVIDIIFKKYVDTGIVTALQPREYYMGFSRKKLQNMHRDVSWYAFVHSNSFYTPPEPEEYPSNTKEYFGDPMIVQKPPQGFEKGGVYNA